MDIIKVPRGMSVRIKISPGIDFCACDEFKELCELYNLTSEDIWNLIILSETVPVNDFYNILGNFLSAHLNKSKEGGKNDD